jgi:hypothetical protein
LVTELVNDFEVVEYIHRNKIACIVIANKEIEHLWNYIIDLFNKLESMVQPKISFAIVHYKVMLDTLKAFEVEIARKSALIKLYLNGNCIFEQEGLLGTKLNDETTLKRGIRESLKLYSVNIRFKIE